MIKNIKKTWKQKLGALALATLGILSTGIDGDATACVLLVMMAIPLFFVKSRFN